MWLWGKPVRATLAELSEAVDVVNVFRRSDALGEHLADILAMRPLPKVVWLQLGIRNDGFAEQLLAAGIDVVQDRCTLAEHRRLGIAHRGVS
jgi:predicted CoA-binding protein